MQTTTWPKLMRPFWYASKLLSVIFMDSAMFIFPTLLADFKDPVQNLDRFPALWLIPPLLFCFNI